MCAQVLLVSLTTAGAAARAIKPDADFFNRLEEAIQVHGLSFGTLANIFEEKV